MEYFKTAINFILGVDDEEPRRVNMSDELDESGLTEDAIAEVMSSAVVSRAIAVRCLKKFNGNPDKALAVCFTCSSRTTNAT